MAYFGSGGTGFIDLDTITRVDAGVANMLVESSAEAALAQSIEAGGISRTDLDNAMTLVSHPTAAAMFPAGHLNIVKNAINSGYAQVGGGGMNGIGELGNVLGVLGAIVGGVKWLGGQVGKLLHLGKDSADKVSTASIDVSKTIDQLIKAANAARDSYTGSSIDNALRGAAQSDTVKTIAIAGAVGLGVLMLARSGKGKG